MSAKLEKCLKMYREARRIRQQNDDLDSPQEDALLDELDGIWRELDEIERAIVEAEGSNVCTSVQIA